MTIAIFPGEPLLVDSGSSGTQYWNTGPDTVYYATTGNVSSTSYDGALTAGSTITLVGRYYFAIANGAEQAIVQANAQTGPVVSPYIQQVPVAGLQPGVYAASDLMVVQHAAGANMTVDVGAGQALVASSTTGLLASVTKATTTTTATISAAMANNRVDQVVVSSLGAISVLTGSEQSGATLDNAAGVTSRAAVPAGSLLLGEFVVGTATTSLTNSVIRDRRPWARGFRFFADPTTSGPTFTSTTAATVPEMTCRAECSGVPIQIDFTGVFTHTVTGDYIDASVYVDGVQLGNSIRGVAAPTAAYNVDLALMCDYVPAAGSHVFDIRVATQAATAAGVLLRRQMRVRESVTQNAKNNATTSG